MDSLLSAMGQVSLWCADVSSVAIDWVKVKRSNCSSSAKYNPSICDGAKVIRLASVAIGDLARDLFLQNIYASRMRNGPELI
jgi:hypothetical protein